MQAQGQAENALTGALGRLFAVAEAYPQLRATENFQQLQAQLADTEQKIAVARQFYNDTVLTYNNAPQTVPYERDRRDLPLPAQGVTSRSKGLRGRRRRSTST